MQIERRAFLAALAMGGLAAGLPPLEARRTDGPATPVMDDYEEGFLVDGRNDDVRGQYVKVGNLVTVSVSTGASLWTGTLTCQYTRA